MRRPLLFGVAVAAAVLVTAPPASAHGGPGTDVPPATNYRTRVTGLEPAVPGLIVRAVDAGTRLQLTNRTGGEVVVLGYAGEPYLRVDADGVFENTRSPATYMNASTSGRVDVPDAADAEAPPEWRWVSGGATAVWHDHRAHWMADGPPSAVEAEPGRRHVIDARFVVPVEVNGRRAEIIGDLTWVPGPGSLPWFALATALGVAVFLAGRTRLRSWAWAAGLVVALGASILDVVGAWTATSGDSASKAGVLVVPVLCWMLAGAGLALLARGREQDALVFVGTSGLGLSLVGGVAGLAYLSHSQLPTALEPWLARTTVAVCLGAGLGLTVAAVSSRWRPRDLIRGRDGRTLAWR